ncbi:MAG: hypothetical protein B0D91_13060, partial [Oceanospirillales bacterium LUC14_002_19_P2]
MASQALIIDYSGVLSAHKRESKPVNNGATAAVYRFQPVRETGAVNKPEEKGPQYMAIPGDNVRRLRQEKGWSMRELAERCVTESKTMDHTTIMRLEKNNGFTLDTLKRVAKALGLES